MLRLLILVLPFLFVFAAKAAAPPAGGANLRRTVSTSAASQTLEKIERPPQFVLISFDGSYSDQFWKESFNLAEKTGAKFSYFISGVYFIEHNDNKMYQAPGHALGSSDIGFGDNNLQDISTRTENVWAALQRGFDIGSHVNGHFDGSKWTESQWISEFTQFNKFVDQVFSIYPTIQESFSSLWDQKIASGMKGFRAPLLAENESTQDALEQLHYLYDSSQVLNGQWPYQMKSGIWNIGLSEISMDGTSRRSIAMDYNILYGQCEGKFNPKNGGECATVTPEILSKFQEQTYQSYIHQFLKSYYGNRAPISIGHHFSLFNRGIYWMALQKFVYAVCTQPDVKCVTHSEMVEWLESQRQARGADYLSALNRAAFTGAEVTSLVKTSLLSGTAPIASAGGALAAASPLNTGMSPTIQPIKLSSRNLVSDFTYEDEVPPGTTVGAVPESSDTALEDDVQKQMLRGDLPEAHMFERMPMDFESTRYTP